jgi:hypothetical protein
VCFIQILVKDRALGVFIQIITWRFVAKHLEPLQGGKIPVEIFVTSKDPEQKAKALESCLDIIKNSGVSLSSFSAPSVPDNERGVVVFDLLMLRPWLSLLN